MKYKDLGQARRLPPRRVGRSEPGSGAGARPLAGQLLEMANQFAGATSDSTIWQALAHHARELLAARAVLVVRRGGQDPAGGFRYSTVFASAWTGPPPEFELAVPVSSMGLALRAAHGRLDGGLGPLFDALADLDPAGVVHAPLNGEETLLLPYCEPVPRPGEVDWRVLEALAGQAGASLERARANARLAALSLADAAANANHRRLIEAVLERSFPRALLGDPLTVAVIRRRAEPGRADGRLAQRLRLHVRESDVVFRLEDGLFVVILHSCGAAGARQFAQRASADLPGADLRWLVADGESQYSGPGELFDAVLTLVPPGVVN